MNSYYYYYWTTGVETRKEKGITGMKVTFRQTYHRLSKVCVHVCACVWVWLCV